MISRSYDAIRQVYKRALESGRVAKLELMSHAHYIDCYMSVLSIQYRISLTAYLPMKSVMCESACVWAYSLSSARRTCAHTTFLAIFHESIV